MPWVPLAIGLGTAAGGALGGLLGGGGDAEVDYSSSNQQNALYGQLFPLIHLMANMSSDTGYGMNRRFNFPYPEMGQAPQMPFAPRPGNLPTPYNIPSIQNMLPTSQWWDDISPQIKEGLYAPYEESADILQERLGSLGQLGSARPGGSAAAGAAMGRLYSDASKNVPLQAFNMTQPAYQSLFNAQLGRNIADYQGRMGQYGTDYNARLERWRNDYQTSLEPWRRNYQAELQSQMLSNQMPFNMAQSLISLIPSTFPQGIAQQPQNMLGNILGGAGTGMLAGSLMTNQGGKGGSAGAGTNQVASFDPKIIKPFGG